MQKHLLLPLFLSIGLILQGCDSKEVAQAEPPPAKVSVLSIQPQSVDFSENLPARVQRSVRRKSVRKSEVSLKRFYLNKVVKLEQGKLYIKLIPRLLRPM